MKTFLNRLRPWTPILSSLAFTLTLTRAFAGGGATTNDGYPIVEFDDIELKAIPSAAALDTTLISLARQMPTAAAAIRARASRIGTGFTLVKVDEKHPYLYAETVGTTIRLWKNFYDLPVFNDAAGAPSQVKVLMHEFAHLLFTGTDERRAKAAGEYLYRVARASRPDLAEAIKAKSALGRVRVDERDLDAASLNPSRPSPTFVLVDELFRQARGLRERCEDYAQSEPVSIGGHEYRLPQVPADYAALIDADAYFAENRRICLGRSLLGVAVGPAIATEVAPSPAQNYFDHTLPFFAFPSFNAAFGRAILARAGAPAPRIDVSNYASNGLHRGFRRSLPTVTAASCRAFGTDPNTMSNAPFTPATSSSVAEPGKENFNVNYTCARFIEAGVTFEFDVNYGLYTAVDHLIPGVRALQSLGAQVSADDIERLVPGFDRWRAVWLANLSARERSAAQSASFTYPWMLWARLPYDIVWSESADGQKITVGKEPAVIAGVQWRTPFPTTCTLGKVAVTPFEGQFPYDSEYPARGHAADIDWSRVFGDVPAYDRLGLSRSTMNLAIWAKSSPLTLKCQTATGGAWGEDRMRATRASRDAFLIYGYSGEFAKAGLTPAGKAFPNTIVIRMGGR